MSFVPSTQSQSQSINPTIEIEIVGVMALLLILSAIPITSKWALYVGFFLLFVTWWGAYTSGNLASFGQELIS